LGFWGFGDGQIRPERARRHQDIKGGQNGGGPGRLRKDRVSACFRSDPVPES